MINDYVLFICCIYKLRSLSCRPKRYRSRGGLIIIIVVIITKLLLLVGCLIVVGPIYHRPTWTDLNMCLKFFNVDGLGYELCSFV